MGKVQKGILRGKTGSASPRGVLCSRFAEVSESHNQTSTVQEGYGF